MAMDKVVWMALGCLEVYLFARNLLCFYRRKQGKLKDDIHTWLVLISLDPGGASPPRRHHAHRDLRAYNCTSNGELYIYFDKACRESV